MNTWFTVFALLVVATTTARLWLSRRQCAHVASHRDTVPDAFRGRVTDEAHRKAADYTIARQRVGRAEALYDAFLALAWTVGGGLALVDAYWRGVLDAPLWQGLLVILSFAVIATLLELPFAAWRTFVVEERFGFNRMTPRLFLTDTLKQIVVMLVLIAPLAAGSLWLMRTSHFWWVWVGCLWVAFLLTMMVLGPRVIAPLFNRFRPLADESLRDRLERLLRRCGFESRGIFVMDASKRSSHGNAYFTGLGRTKRIVFFDTLLDDLEDPEVEAVLAHELGHFRLHHVPRRLLVTSLASFLALAVLDLLMQRPGFFQGLGVPEPSAHMALLLFFVAGPYVGYFITPLFAWLSRRDEYAADDFAARNADALRLGTALVKLTEENAQTLTPDPWHSAFYDSHPPVAARIRELEHQAS